MNRAEPQSGVPGDGARAEHSARSDDYIDVRFRCPVCKKRCVVRVSQRSLEESRLRHEMDFGAPGKAASPLVCESCYGLVVKLISPRRN